MAAVQCERGHLYDNGKTPVCPYCTGQDGIGVARPLSQTSEIKAPAFPKTMPVSNSVIPKTMPVSNSVIPKTMPINNSQIKETVPESINNNGINPVCGWLVCVHGEKKGKDFRIYNEKNYMGRLPSNDICLEFDESISKESSAIISFDSRNDVFYIQSDGGKNNIYVNEKLLLAPTELNDYDLIEIGKTKLVLRTLCNNRFNWDKFSGDDGNR